MTSTSESPLGLLSKTLSDKVAIVTGSSRGIGASVALRLAQHGASVTINYVSSASRAEEVAEKARSLGVKAITVKADVTKKEELAQLFERTKKELGRVDIVMSNSGIEHFGSLSDVKEDEIDAVFAVNVKAQYFVAQMAEKHMEDGGRLMLISSVSAVMGVPRHAIYAASKAAIIGMTKCLAWDFGSRGITVNCIAPGGVVTEMYEQQSKNYIPGGADMSMEEINARISKWSPLGRPGYPDDVAGVVALLSSPEAQWLTGQTFHVSGGAHMAS
ncbi:uncharacterized protein BKA78DRAFT_332087 [Phyllosticta capitalensis]|uniref:Ketoreductase domain-containing protein n=1 Tax=Phyllosticta capitalensis TaxID=121624 RepID=A0ABR1YNB2_9PEZI